MQRKLLVNECIFVTELTFNIITARNEVWGKVIFSVACVKDSVHRGGLPHCMLGYTPRWDQRQTPHPLDQRQTLPPTLPHPPPGSRHPLLCSACWEIRATSGRYASYWNSIFLSVILMQENLLVVTEPCEGKFNCSEKSRKKCQVET